MKSDYPSFNPYAIGAVLLLMFVSMQSQAGQVSVEPFGPGQVLTHDSLNTRLNAIATEVNNNDNAVQQKQASTTKVCEQGQAIGSITPDGVATCVDLGSTQAPSNAITDVNVPAGSAITINRLNNAVTIDANIQDGHVPATIARDAEVDGKINTHSGDAAAHHSKTSNFNELSGTLTDTQVPATITRDAELTAHANDPAAHHARYTDSDALAAVQAAGGPGSNIDADTLDGLNSSDFVTSDQGCPAGEVIRGFDINGNRVCAATSRLASVQDNVFHQVALDTLNITDIRSVQVTPTANGLVMVFATGTGRLVHPSVSLNNNNNSLMYFTITDNNTDATFPVFKQHLQIPGATAGGTYDLNMAANRVFPVQAGQTYTFYLRAQVRTHPLVGGGIFHAVFNSTLQALFIPQ